MILHVDMDAFYASVEEREDPSLVGKPVIVGGTPQGRGVVCAANYEARRYGVHSAMPAAIAVRLCPHAVFLRTRMDFYARISKQIREIFHRFTPLVEPLSLDEAFLDVTGSRRLFGEPIEIARQIKRTIAGELRLVASVGVAPNKLLAKIASDLDKPDGLVFVDPDNVQAFLDPLPIGRLWGVGREAGKVFEALGARTIGDLRRLPGDLLQTRFGVHGESLLRRAQGMDDRPVTPDREAKSISHETTFAADIRDADALHAWLLELTEQVGRRLRRHALRGRTVHLKLRFSDFRTITRSRTLEEATHNTQTLWRVARELLADCPPPDRRPARLLGMGVSGLEREAQHQGGLFDEADHERAEEIDRMTDDIRDRFGDQAIRRASALQHNVRHRPQPRPNDDDAGA